MSVYCSIDEPILTEYALDKLQDDELKEKFTRFQQTLIEFFPASSSHFNLVSSVWFMSVMISCIINRGVEYIKTINSKIEQIIRVC